MTFSPHASCLFMFLIIIPDCFIGNLYDVSSTVMLFSLQGLETESRPCLHKRHIHWCLLVLFTLIQGLYESKYDLFCIVIYLFTYKVGPDTISIPFQDFKGFFNIRDYFIYWGLSPLPPLSLPKMALLSSFSKRISVY